MNLIQGEEFGIRQVGFRCARLAMCLLNLANFRLRVQLDTEASITLHYNDHQVELHRVPDLEKQNGLFWYTGIVPQETIIKGQNQVKILLGQSPAALTRLTGLELLIRN